jgi:gamma-D-glutamyl-L-lysine dipeptidyl-peptidase
MWMLLALASATLPHAVVLRPVANMYARPDLDADVVSQAIYAANVAIVKQQGTFLRIRTADDYEGWVQSEVVRGETKPYAVSGKVAQVENLFAHIYREPNVTRHAPLLTVPFETRLEVIAESANRWLQLRLPDDHQGWVQQGDVSLDPPKLSIPEMIELSKRFIGLPYTWGGTSSFGYDCSGFVQMLCRRRGITIPRDADPQAHWSGVVPVQRDQLQPGDLLYFGRSAAKIIHTGLYIGGGRFINATTWQKPMVQICELAEPHWTELVVACRRLK